MPAPVAPPRWMHRALTVAVLYFVIGRLSLLLAIPPGFASPVWPAAGLALAAVLLLGGRVWPGILLGSLAVNLSMAVDTTSVIAFVRSVAIALAIGGGAAAQAVVGGLLTRRFIDLTAPEPGLASVLRAELLGGPVACLVSPTVGVATLVTAGVAGWDEAGLNWIAWWVGDAMGVLVVVPLVVAWMQRRETDARLHGLAITTPLACAIAVTVILFLFARNSTARTNRHHFEVDAQRVTQNLQAAINGCTSELQSIASLFDASDEVTRDEFAAFVRHSITRRPGLRALEWVPAIPGDERAKHEAAVRGEPCPNTHAYTVSERVDGALVPARAHDIHLPVAFVEPLAGNEAAIGFDLASEPARLRALERARDTGRVVATSGIALVQSDGAGPGLLVAKPIYHGSVPVTVEERRARLEGFALGVFEIDELIDGACAGTPHDEFALAVTDVTSPGAFSPIQPAPTGTEAALVPPAAFDATKGFETTVDVGDRVWSCVFTPRDAFFEAHTSWGPWVVIVSGFLVSGFLGAVLMVVTGRDLAARRLLAAQSRELTVTNARLELKNTELEQFVSTVSHDLKSPLLTIRGYAGFLRDDVEEGRADRVRHFIERIIAAGTRMSALIDDLLVLSRAGRIMGHLDCVDTQALARGVVSLMEIQIADAEATVIIEDDMPDVCADRDRLAQALQNIVGNALKYGRSADGRARIRIGGAVVGNEVHLHVSDAGPGIGDDDREGIFGLFQRVSGDGEGTGVGLAIVKRVAEVHGGRVWVETADPTSGTGARFVIAIPRDEIGAVGGRIDVVSSQRAA